MPAIHVRPLTDTDRPWVRRFVADQWGAEFVVVHDCVYYPHELAGYLALSGETTVGLATYTVSGDNCEIVTLNSLRSGQGIGSALIEAVSRGAIEAGCRRLWLITTNDNLPALAFYQKRGFTLAAVHREAVARARQIKPSIPLLGYAGIPIRDEIELEMRLLP